MLSAPSNTAFAFSSSQQLSQTIVQTLYEGVVLIGDDGAVVFANATAEMLLGYAPGDLLLRHYNDFLEAEACRLLTLSAGQAHRYTRKLRHPDGRIIPSTFTITSILINEVEYWLVTIAALPNLGPLQDTLMMQQRLAGIGVLTASIAHELNNPLSIITTTCENLDHALEQETADKATLTRYVKMVQKNAWRSANLVDALRSYAHGPQLPQQNDLNDIIEQSLTLVSEQFQRKWRIRVQADLSPDLKSVTCDQNQIIQVLINLLMNARDAMQPEGGEVAVKSWFVPDLNAAAFSVKDSGTGIEEHLLDTIFDPFYTSKGRGEGTGLGLYVAAEIIREHKGWIRAQNNEDNGAIFTVMLPCR